MKYMHANLAELLTTPMFGRLNFDVLVDVLGQPTDTPGIDEIKFKAIASWIQADGSHSEQLSKLFSLISQENLTASFIAAQIASDSAITNSPVAR